MSFRWGLLWIIPLRRNFCAERLMGCPPRSYLTNPVGARFLTWLGLNMNRLRPLAVTAFQKHCRCRGKSGTRARCGSAAGCCPAWCCPARPCAQPSAGGAPPHPRRLQCRFSLGFLWNFAWTRPLLQLQKRCFTVRILRVLRVGCCSLLCSRLLCLCRGAQLAMHKLCMGFQTPFWCS